MNLEIQAYKTGIDQLIQRPADALGEPSSKLSPDAFEQYREALIRLGVPASDAEACKTVTQNLYDPESNARKNLAQETVSYLVEGGHQEKVLLETLGNNLLDHSSTVPHETEAAQELLERAKDIQRTLCLPKKIIHGIVDRTIDNVIVNAIKGALSAAGIDQQTNAREIEIRPRLQNRQVVYQEQEEE